VFLGYIPPKAVSAKQVTASHFFQNREKWNYRNRRFLVCPKCKGDLRVISSIKDPSVIRVILDHLGIWLVRSRPLPKIHDPPIREYAAVDLHLQTHADDFYGDPDYFWDEYIQSYRCQISIDKQKQPPILPSIESNILSNAVLIS